MAENDELTPKEQELEKQLLEAREAAEKAETLVRQLVNDPDVNVVIRKRQAGESVKFAEDTPAKPAKVNVLKTVAEAEPKYTDEDIDQLRPSQLLRLIMPAFQEAAEEITVRHIDKARDEVASVLANQEVKISKMDRALMEQARKTGVERARTTLPGYNEVEEDINKEVERIQKTGVNIDDVYHMVVGKKRAGLPPKEQLDSEHSTATPSRVRTERSVDEGVFKTTARPGSKAAFSELVNQGVARRLEKREIEAPEDVSATVGGRAVRFIR